MGFSHLTIMKLGMIFLLAFLGGCAGSEDPLSESERSSSQQRKPKNAPQSDLDQLQGHWNVKQILFDGSIFNVPVKPLTINGTSFVWPFMHEPATGKLKLDTSKAPSWIDFKITEGKKKGMTYIAIYKIEGDILTLCVFRAHFNKNRPTDFKSTSTIHNILFTYKRQK